jgi:hypothetical protein
MAIPAAPAAGAGIEALAGLFAILAFVVLLGLQQTWRATIGWLFLKLADLLDAVSFSVAHITVAPFGFAANALRAASHNVYAALGYAAIHVERGALWLFHQAAHQLQWLGREIEGLSLDTWRAFDVVYTHGIPVGVRLHTKPLAQKVARVDARTRTWEHHSRVTEAGLTHKAAVTHKAVAVTLPHAIGATNARVGITSRQLRRLSRRLSKVEKLTLGAGAAALVATAFGRLGLRWLRCPALGRVGRKIGCGGFGFLETLLAETFEAMLILDLCRMAVAMQRLAREVVPALGVFLLVENAVCLGGGASLPSAFDSPRVTTRITLPSAHD